MKDLSEETKSDLAGVVFSKLEDFRYWLRKNQEKTSLNQDILDHYSALVKRYERIRAEIAEVWKL